MALTKCPHTAPAPLAVVVALLMRHARSSSDISVAIAVVVVVGFLLYETTVCSRFPSFPSFHFPFPC